MFNGGGAGKLFGGRGRYSALCLLFIFAVLLAGCGGVKGPSGEEYFKSLDRWSRGQKVYQGLEARLYMNATLKTAEFRRAYMERYAAMYELSPGHAKAMAERENEQAEAFNEFFFTAYTPDETLNDFDESESVWQMYIEDSAGNRSRPISITEVDSSEHVIREFFPYFDLWSKAYTVKFPKYADTGGEINPEKGPVKLIVTGVMGKGELEWRPEK
ncbi:hypothetical protein BAC1_00792 [uncultured bacterium]|nr:hypothetical protein BAC1_00792 [uncultured bacterium]